MHGRELYVISPLMDLGSCRDILNQHFPEGLQEIVCAIALRDVLCALDYLHKQLYIHRWIFYSFCESNLQGAGKSWQYYEVISRNCMHQYEHMQKLFIHWSVLLLILLEPHVISSCKSPHFIICPHCPHMVKQLPPTGSYIQKNTTKSRAKSPQTKFCLPLNQILDGQIILAPYQVTLKVLKTNKAFL